MNLDTSHSARAASGAHALHGARHAGAGNGPAAGTGAGLSFLSLLGGAQDALGSDTSLTAANPLAATPSATDGLPWLAGLPMAAQPLPTGLNLLKSDDGQTTTSELIDATDAQAALPVAIAATASPLGATTDDTPSAENLASLLVPDPATMNLATVFPTGTTPVPAQPLPGVVSAPVARSVQATLAASRGAPQPSLPLEPPLSVTAPTPRAVVPTATAVNARPVPAADAPRDNAVTLPGAASPGVNVNPASPRAAQPSGPAQASSDPVPAALVAAIPAEPPQTPAPDALVSLAQVPVAAGPSPAASGLVPAPVQVRPERLDAPSGAIPNAPAMPAAVTTAVVISASASPVAPGRPFDTRPSAPQDVAVRWTAPDAANATAPVAAKPELAAAVQPVPVMVIQPPAAQPQAPTRTTVQMYGAAPAPAQPVGPTSAGVPAENSATATVLGATAAAEAAAPASRGDAKPTGVNPAREARVLAQRGERLADANAVVSRAAPEPAAGLSQAMPGVVASAQGLWREPGAKRNERTEGAVAALDNGWRAGPAPMDSNAAGAGTGLAPEQAVADQIQNMVSQNVKNADFQLDLGGQGKVDVSISMNGSEARVEFRSDQATTRDLLGQTLGQLDELLRREGLVLSGASVGTSAGQSGQAFQPPVPTLQREDRPAAPMSASDPASTAQAPRRSVAAQGMVDLYA